MKPKSFFYKKWVRIFCLVLTLIVIGVWTAGIFISNHYEKILKDRLKENLPPSLDIEFSALKISVGGRFIRVKDLSIIYHPDSLNLTHRHTLRIGDLRLHGVHFLELVTDKKLTINRIIIDSMNLSLSKELLKDSVHRPATRPKRDTASFIPGGITIHDLRFNRCAVNYHTDSTRELTAAFNLHFQDIALPGKMDSLTMEQVHFMLTSAGIENITFSPSDGFYSTSVKNIILDKRETYSITIDSVLVKPLYGKFEFAHKFGKQTDRMNVSIPRVQIKECALEKLADSSFTATAVHIYSASLKAFRDKRLPFIRHKDVPLPVALFKSLPFQIAIDTIRLHDANVVYEEFPEEGNASGVLVFEKLNASLFKVNNRSDSKHIDLDVTTRFMGAGNLAASFDLPLDKKAPYRVEGVLSGFNITALNPTLEHLARIKVQSGIINSMKFAFTHDDVESIGKLIINYEDLKLISLKKKESVTTVDRFKTFLLNAVVIRKSKDESLAEEKREGFIHFRRDRKRAIFNYWWKSILSGLQPSYDLDKKKKK